LSSRAKEEFKRDREDKSGPAVLPEVEPGLRGCTALPVAKGVVTEPVLAIYFGGEEYLFMVDTSAMVSLIQPGISKAQVQPCDVQARGVTGTKLDILGEQEVEFILRSNNGDITFVNTYVVSLLKRCSSGILGMDFLQRVGAEISLTDQLIYIDRYSFPLRGQEQGVLEVQRLISAEQTNSLSHDQEEDESVEDWEGTIELVETVTLPPLSGRIARCRVVRRGDSMVVDKVPWCNEAVSLDPEGLPGIYVARIVATLDVCDLMSSTDAKRMEPVSGRKSPLGNNVVLPPEELLKIKGKQKIVAGCDGSTAITICDDGVLNVGSGECLPKCPEGGNVPVATKSRGNDLQAVSSGSFPVENSCGNHVDTNKCGSGYQRYTRASNKRKVEN
jgi:hypothetical protein